MAQMLVRNIDENVAARFKAKAKAEGKSAEQVLRDLMSGYVERSIVDRIAALDAIRATTVGKPIIDPVAIIRRDRDSDYGSD